MKKVFLKLLFASLIISTVIACGDKSGDPKTVAKNFFEALQTMNIDEASKYATKESKTMLDLLKMGMSMAPDKTDSLKAEMAKQKIEYSDPVIKGDEAMLSVTVDGKDKTDFNLKKEDGEWKVAFDKNTLMKSGMNKMEDQGASPQDLQDAQKIIDSLSVDTAQ